MTASTGKISTLATAADFPSLVAGTPSFALGGMTLASDGNFYVLVDAGTYELIYEFNTATQAVTVVAGGQQPNYSGSCGYGGSVSGNPSAPITGIAEGQAGYPGAQLFILTNGVVASTGDLTSDASGNIYYSGAQCNTPDIYDYRPAVFRINLPTDTVYLETVGETVGSGGTATSNYGAYTGFSIGPASAIPDGNGDLYFTTNNQIAVVSASAGALDFGQQNQFTTGITRIATYENVGNATDTNPAYSLESGLDFTDVSSTDTNACNLLTEVGVNKTCNIDYAFTPTQPNAITDTINLAEATPGSNPGFGLTTSAQTVTLTGDATPEAQFLVTPTSMDFGNVAVGQSSTKSFVVSNAAGGAALGLYGIYVYPNGTAAPPTEYTLGGTCDPSATSFSVPAGGSCTISVTFTPTTATPYPTTLTINNSVTNPEEATFAITGTGTSSSTPTATLMTSPLAFGNQTVNTSSAGQNLTLANTSSTTLHISGITIGGTNPSDFSDTTTCGTTLAANASCTITVTFTPLTATAFAATLSVADNASGSPQTATLSGTGTAVAMATATLSPNPLVFSNVSVNNSSIGTATLTNTSMVTLSNIVPSITGTGASAYSLYPTGTCGSTLAANTSCTYVLHFSPSAGGGYAATLSVTDSASGSPQTIALSGAGTPAAAPQVQFTPTELNVIAGTGTMPANCVDPAERGPALQTQLCGPNSVAVDEAGNVYIAEQLENVVKKLDTSGNITTFAGMENSGAGSYSGDNGPATAANLSWALRWMRLAMCMYPTLATDAFAK